MLQAVGIDLVPHLELAVGYRHLQVPQDLDRVTAAVDVDELIASAVMHEGREALALAWRQLLRKCRR